MSCFFALGSFWLFSDTSEIVFLPETRVCLFDCLSGGEDVFKH